MGKVQPVTLLDSVFIDGVMFQIAEVDSPGHEPQIRLVHYGWGNWIPIDTAEKLNRVIAQYRRDNTASPLPSEPDTRVSYEDDEQDTQHSVHRLPGDEIVPTEQSTQRWLDEQRETRERRRSVEATAPNLDGLLFDFLRKLTAACDRIARTPMVFGLLTLLIVAVPAFAEPTLEHREALQEPEVLASPTSSPVPSPTPLPPLCSETNPSLTRCLAVQDPAAVLNQRVTALEQREQQIIQLLQQLAQKVEGQTVKKK